MHELFQIDIGVFGAVSDASIERVQICYGSLALDLKVLCLLLEYGFVDSTECHFGLQVRFAIKGSSLVESLTFFIFCCQ